MMFMFSPRCVVRHLLWGMLVTALMPSGVHAAPPDFAGAGMAPSDVDVLVRMSGKEADDNWSRYFEDVASDSLGKNPVLQWRTLTSFLRSIVGQRVEGEDPVSHLYIRFGTPGTDVAWVFSVELTDRGACERGFRESGVILKSDGGFLLPDGNIEIHVSGGWLVAGPVDSLLLDEVSRNAAIDVRASDDPRLLEAIASLPRSPLEILVRHESPMGGFTAATISEVSPGIAEVLVHGRYDASPFPSRKPDDLDMRLINVDGDRASLTIHEAGVGILDPLLIDIGMSIPEVLPPVDVRQGLGLQRILVLETVPLGDQFRAPAMCVAIPFRTDDPERILEVSSSIAKWMKEITAVFGLDEPNQASIKKAEDSVASRVASSLRVAALEVVGNHPLVEGATLNWDISTGTDSKPWFVVGTTSGSVDRLAQRLASLSKEGALDRTSASQGRVYADQLAAVIRSFAEIRGNGGDVKAKEDSRLLNVMVDIASRFEGVEWNFHRQGPKDISGCIQLSIPSSVSSSEEVMAP